VKAGVSEKVAMTISGHRTRIVFDRYHSVDTEDVMAALRRVLANGNLSAPSSEEPSSKASAKAVNSIVFNYSGVV
jgi:hypothetical protein